jgi:amino acid adenylation domain-containing protein
MARCDLKIVANITQVERRDPLKPLHPAYVIYTSGSTGRPNGVLGLHAGLVNRIRWFHALRPFGPEHPVLAKTSMSFVDGSTELLGALLSGGTVALAPASGADAAQFASLIRRYGVGQITLVPGLLRTLLAELQPDDLCACERWITSGEALSPSLARRFEESCPGAELLNLYGMSEASGDSLWTVCRAGDVAFAAPVDHTDVYVLDTFLQPVPIGVSGEVYVGGVGLARGYVKRAALTAARFIANPYGVPGSRVYRTGDIGRWRRDGRLEILGRSDRQIKIAGVRIELDEIERALLELPDIRDAAVASVMSGAAPSVVAWIMPRLGLPLDRGRLRRNLAHRLPLGTIPSTFVMVDEIPRLPSGKVDRARLLIEMASDRVESDSEPTTPEERTLCQIFSDVFKDERVGPTSDFVALGGHSLDALRLANRVRSAFDVELEPMAIFDMPTVRELAAHVVAMRAGAGDGSGA